MTYKQLEAVLKNYHNMRMIGMTHTHTMMALIGVHPSVDVLYSKECEQGQR